MLLILALVGVFFLSHLFLSLKLHACSTRKSSGSWVLGLHAVPLSLSGTRMIIVEYILNVAVVGDGVGVLEATIITNICIVMLITRVMLYSHLPSPGPPRHKG